MADLSAIDVRTMPSDDFQFTDVTVPQACRVIWGDECWPHDSRYEVLHSCQPRRANLVP
jgi:hypothetical protein